MLLCPFIDVIVKLYKLSSICFFSISREEFSARLSFSTLDLAVVVSSLNMMSPESTVVLLDDVVDIQSTMSSCNSSSDLLTSPFIYATGKNDEKKIITLEKKNCIQLTFALKPRYFGFA